MLGAYPAGNSLNAKGKNAKDSFVYCLKKEVIANGKQKNVHDEDS